MEKVLPPLNMSSLTAVQILISESHLNDNSSLINIHRKRHDPAWSHLDWTNGEKWLPTLQKEQLTADTKLLCRRACTEFVFCSTLLTKLAGRGREALVATLSEDELQVFRNAMLLDEIPSVDVLKWWDEFRALGRKLKNDTNVEQGREAELWTMQNEIKAVSQFNKGNRPVWVALNGDQFGYDILSFRQTSSSSPHVILIEVKSFASKAQPKIFITRKEWNKALESEPNYFFVVWCMEIKEFRTFNVSDLMSHIPSDTGKGVWQNIEIEIEKWWH